MFKKFLLIVIFSLTFLNVNATNSSIQAQSCSQKNYIEGADYAGRGSAGRESQCDEDPPETGKCDGCGFRDGDPSSYVVCPTGQVITCPPQPNVSPTADVGTQNGCEVPIANDNAFWLSPQSREGNGDLVYSGQSCDVNPQDSKPTMINGGCGGNTPLGVSCGEVGKYFATESCMNDRDGTFKCGGRAGCAEGVKCDTTYIDDKQWGTNPGQQKVGFDTQSSAVEGNVLQRDSYRFCELANNRATADQVCNITGTKRNAQGDEIFCRCGQSDVCASDNMSTEDLEAEPANLKITSLHMAENIGPTGQTPLTNSLEKQNLVVSFDVVDLQSYQNSGSLSMTQEMIDKSILYTRLIEICPINIADQVNNSDWNNEANWQTQPNDLCVIKRVDGDINKIREPISIPVGGTNLAQLINKTEISQGPWTVRFRTINDVCNRTYGDFVVASGQTKTCASDDCIKIGEHDTDVTGRFGGIKARGNAPAGAYGSGTVAQLNYCSIRDTQVDTIIDYGRPNSNTNDSGMIPVRAGDQQAYPGPNYTDDNQTIDKFLET